MKVALRMGLLLFLFAQFVSNGLTQSGIITTYVGPRYPIDGAMAVSQAVDVPKFVIPDGTGGFYVTSWSQCSLYQVKADGTLSYVVANRGCGFGGDDKSATVAMLNHPIGIAIDSAGNLYIADEGNNRIRKITTSGKISTIAGDGIAGFGGDGGLATAAKLNSPSGIAIDSAGNLYIADTDNNRIRKITASGKISTIAGNGTAGFGGDLGFATSAKLQNPSGIAVDSAGTLYIADKANNRIRKVITTGIINTIAGNGTAGFSGDGGIATAAQLQMPSGVAIDFAGNLYIADAANARIRKVTSYGIISTVAGANPGLGDGGPAEAAGLSTPSGIAIDSEGNLYIADTDNNRIRKIIASGIISTVAGNGTRGSGGDGGPASAAQLDYPGSLEVDSADNLYISNYGDNLVRKVTAAGVISTAASGLHHSFGVAVDQAGNIYVAERDLGIIRKITPTGVKSTVAGGGTSGLGDGGPANAAHLNEPYDVAFDSAGNLIISDAGNGRIRKVTPTGIISTIAGGGTVDANGVPATDVALYMPLCLAVDSADNVFFSESSKGRIRKVTLAGIISTVAGGGSDLGDGGPATATQLYWPEGLAVDSAGNLYIADEGDNRIRKVTAAGIISTIAGDGTAGFGGDGGLATAAQLYDPNDVAIDSVGNIYIADTANQRIRIVVAALPTVATTAITSITQTTASGGGNVTSDGGASVTARGICWSTSANPTMANICTSNGTGTGAFIGSIAGLTAGMSYHVRAYATNVVGTAYGSDASFTTLALVPDFQISARTGGSYSATVAAGSSAVYNLSVAAINGFSGTVGFTCSGLPTAAACSISPTTLSVSGAAAASLTVTITTTARTSTVGITKDSGRSPWAGSAPAAILCLSSLIMMIRMPKRRISIALLMLCVVGIAGCGGGSKKNTSTQGTPAGTYSVVLKSTSGSISHNTNLTLTVQ